MTRHAQLGASKARRWMACPGSVKMTRDLPDVETPYSREGTAAHELAAGWLKRTDGPSHRGVDPEMVEGVRPYVEYVQNRVKEMAYGGADGRLFVEETFDLADLQPAEEMYGTADAVLIAGREIEVVDLKYGSGVVVQVRRDGHVNEQLLFYLLGAVLKHWRKAYPLAFPTDQGVAVAASAVELFDRMSVTIVQPRATHADGVVRSTDVTAGELLDFVEELLRKAKATHAPDAPLHAGDWCRFCPAHASCPEAYAHAQLVAQTVFDVVPADTPPSPESLPIAVVGSVLAQAHVLEEWLRALRRRAEAELRAGRSVPGFKLVAKRATRQWADTNSALAAIHACNVDPYQPHTAISPAEFERRAGFKLNPKRDGPGLETVKYSSGVTLAPDADPRPAVPAGPETAFDVLSSGAQEADIEDGQG